MRFGGKIMVGLIPAAVLIAFSAAAQQPVSPDAGQEMFRQTCGGCHLENGFGTRVLARRVPEGEAELASRQVLPAALVRLAVRRGIGSMPAIRAAELSDADLETIAQYLEGGR